MFKKILIVAISFFSCLFLISCSSGRMLNGVCVPEKVSYVQDYGKEKLHITKHYFLKEKSLLVVFERKHKEAILYNASSGVIQTKIKLASHPNEMILSPDGKTLIILRIELINPKDISKEQAVIDIIDVNSKKIQSKVPPSQFYFPSKIEFSSDSKSLIVAKDGKIIIYSIEGLKPQYEIDMRSIALKERKAWFSSFELNSNRSKLAYFIYKVDPNDTRLTVSIIDLSRREKTIEFNFVRDNVRWEQFFFSHDGNQLAHLDQARGILQIYDFDSREVKTSRIKVNFDGIDFGNRFLSPLLHQGRLFFSQGGSIYAALASNNEESLKITNSEIRYSEFIHVLSNGSLLSVSESNVTLLSCQ